MTTLLRMGLLVLGGMGCVSVRVIPGSASPATAPRTFAVLELTSDVPDVAGRAQDGCIAGIVGSGGRPVERARVSALTRERDLGRSGETQPEFYLQLGRMLGADAFVVGSVGTRSGRARSVSVRLIHAESGDLMRMVDLRGSEDDGFEYGERACRALMLGQDG
jgi:hypothetical protein